MSQPDIPACLACGACCFSRSQRYVAVRGDDYERLGEQAEQLTFFHENRCYMRMEEQHCAALRVTAEGQFVCSVYAQRPSICRELERGSPSCEAELLEKRALPQGALITLRTRARP